jgi:cytochrome c-type biogenesis protein
MAVQSTARSPSAGRFATFMHAVAFVLGFSAVFVALGAAVTAVGQLLYDLRSWLALIGGIVVVIFGLATAGWINIPFLEYDTRYQGAAGHDLGYLSSFLMGVFFSAGWTPCVGPTLGAILTLGLSESTVGQGVFLLVGYSLGLGIPFLVTGLALDRATTLLRRAKRYMPAIKMTTAVLLILIGVLLLVDSLPHVVPQVGDWFGASWMLTFPAWAPSIQGLSRWALSRGLFLDVSPSGAAITPTFFVAFLAGLLSFLSPCVLPLVPAYIGYLGGRAVNQAAKAA